MRRALRRLLPAVGALAVASFAASAAYADVIFIQSGSPAPGQSETCTNNATAVSNTCVSITPAPSWQSNNPGFAPGTPGFDDVSSSAAVWISFAATGFPPDHTFVSPGNSMTITYTFMAPPEAQFLGRLWSDNLSNIYLDGMLVGGGTATVGGGTSYGSGGGYAIDSTLGAGTGGGDVTNHTFVITTTQGSGGRNNATNPFGTLFVGEVGNTGTAVPEPASLALLGLGLALAGAPRRRRVQV